MQIFLVLIPGILGYLVGSINFSILVTKYIGRFDIHAKGSGNAGGTNVARTMGAGWGIAVIVAEILKGVVVGMFVRYIFPVDPLSLGELGPAITGAFAVFCCFIGNVFPVFYKFRGGGKGVTVCGAMMTMLDVRVFLVLLGIFLVVFLFSRMVSLASIVGVISMSVSTAVVYHGQEYWWVLFLIVTAMAVGVIIRHKANIVRIFHGNENKFSFSKKKKA